MLIPGTRASSQVPDPEPEDEEELREVLDAEELRSFLRSVKNTRRDSLLFDVRGLPGIRLPSSQNGAVLPDSTGKGGVDRYRRMFVEAPEYHERGLRIRSVISQSGSSHNGQTVLKERSVLKWEIYGEKGGGSFGEISMSSAPGSDQSTSVTAHVVGDEGRWSLSLGDLTDRSASTTIEDDRPVRLRALRPDRPSLGPGREFSKPSFLRDALTVSGVGFSIAFGQGTHVSALVGRKLGARSDRPGVSIGVNQLVSTRFRIGASMRSDGDPESVKPTLTAEIEMQNVLVGAAAAITRDGDVSALVQALVQPARAVRLSFTAWTKRVQPEPSGSDQGLGVILRWNFSAGHFFEMSSAGGELSAGSGVILRRAHALARVSGKSFQSVQWSASFRQSTEEEHSNGSVSERGRADHYVSVRVRLSDMLFGLVKFRHARLNSPGESGHSSALEWQLSGDLDPFRASTWFGVFRAVPGLTLWSSHPGFMLWPVSAVLGGSGSHWGASVRTVVWERTTVAGYVSSIVHDTPRGIRSSILVEVAL